MNDWPLVGRAAELAAIIERIDHEPPVAVVIGGAAGVGKSRLLREVAARRGSRAGRPISSSGTRTAASIPFGAVVSLLTGLVEDASSVEILAHARRALSAGDGDLRHLLVVDDAQRLDPGSATLVHQVVVEGCAGGGDGALGRAGARRHREPLDGRSGGAD